jgi:hypothetical protein
MLLGVTLTIPILQIVWRFVEHRQGPVYVTETTMEVAASVLFILKLLLDVFLSPTDLSRALRSSVAPIGALLIGIGISIGNFICCG